MEGCFKRIANPAFIFFNICDKISQENIVRRIEYGFNN